MDFNININPEVIEEHKYKLNKSISTLSESCRSLAESFKKNHKAFIAFSQTPQVKKMISEYMDVDAEIIKYCNKQGLDYVKFKDYVKEVSNETVMTFRESFYYAIGIYEEEISIEEAFYGKM